MRAFILSLLLFFVLNREILFAKEAYWEEHHIELSGLSDEQVRILESTINQLRMLEPGELKMNKKIYRRLSRFKELFGISFQGKEVADWLLARIKGISYHNSSTAALNQNSGHFVVGDIFFAQINTLERLYLLIHEARHSDGEGYDHVKCPKGFKTVSATQPELDLEKERACDDTQEGAYAFQAAFLFELYAYGLFDQKEVGLLYNSSISRVLP
jgi:hypothetical protein